MLSPPLHKGREHNISDYQRMQKKRADGLMPASPIRIKQGLNYS